MREPIYVTRPNLPNREKLFGYLEGALDRRQLTNNGPLVQELSARLSAYLGVSNLVLVANGTVALDLAIRLADFSGEVLTTPFSFPATSSALIWTGRTPIYVDIAEDSFNLDPNLARIAIERQRCSLLATHVYGNPCDVLALQNLAAEYDVSLVYDAAHAFGVEMSNKSVLEWGDVSILSFHATKTFNTLEGGALVCRDSEMFDKAKRMINFGFNDSGFVDQIGVNGKMNEFEAAVGLTLLDDIDHYIAEQKSVSLAYRDNLSPDVMHQRIHQDASHLNYGYVPVCFPDENTCTEAMNRMLSENIFPRRYFYPSLDTVEAFGQSPNCRVSQDIASRILCLPSYAGLQLGTIEEISSMVNAVL